ncbi:hypothetical protein [uncultured Clostridium sp.]|uniref:hypothetical protein n=1 Tax=uncultured Clostridium sp. TaxID=59620 RepID=UPI00261485C3|nr:hypothetical protein [uncultured Clostridium sp.]
MAARDFLKVLSKVEIDMMRATLMLDLQKQIINEQDPINLKNQMATIGIAMEISGIQATHPEEFKPLEKVADKNWEMWYEMNQQFTSLKGVM